MGVRVRGSGRGKLILFGEHAAVYGHPAVGLGLSERLEVELEPGGTEWLLDGVGSVGQEGQDALGLALSILGENLPALGAGGRITLRSGIPKGVGLGSSAALCVALAEAALRLEEAPSGMDRGRVWALAHAAEKAFHGRPSGIDTGLAALGGILRFETSPPSLPRAIRLDCPPLHLVVGALPRGSNTARLVASLGERLSLETKTAAAVGRLGCLASEASSLLAGGGADAVGLGVLADEAERLLEFLGLVDPRLPDLIAAGRAAGATGAKMSGAGGGGAFFLVFPGSAGAERGALAVNKAAEALGVELSWPARALSPGHRP